ncbi:hypothetical protein LKK83_16625, partial [Phormidium sp. CCY1219]|nr:hypothetical protein [Phormidium sp. CCY1219]
MVKKEFDQSSTQPAQRIRRQREGRIRAVTNKLFSARKSQRPQDKKGARANSSPEIEPIEALPVTGADEAQPAEGKDVGEKTEEKKGSFAAKPLAQAWNKSRRILWGWHVLWLSLIVAFTSVGTVSLRWLLTMPPPVNCEGLTVGAPDRDRLYCAQSAAKSGELDKLVEAIELVNSWPSDHPMRAQGERLQEEWSKLLLDIARQKFSQGDLDGAIAIVEKIPESNAVRAEADLEAQSWQGDWEKGEAIYEKALAALKARNWNQVDAHTRALLKLENIHWRSTRYSQIKQRMKTEKQAWEKLEDARYLVWYKTAEEFIRAIDKARQINPNTYVSEEAKKQIEQWSRQLLDIAKERFEEGELDGAIAAAKWVPRDTTVYRESQDLIQLSQAQALVKDDKPSGPIGERLLAFLEASATADQIQPDSPLYKKAQEKQARWKQYQQDLIQVQLANSVASFRHPLLMRLAIEQALMVKPDRPGRIDAQTEIARWRKEIQEIEDRGYVVAARAIANGQNQNINALKNAIASAKNVEMGRPLRIEAQTLIAQWTKQIQRLEDQPILDEAQTLAKNGKLKEAVTTAEKIAEGRALYSEAQNRISDWVAEIQIAEDRPILDEAASLAAQGRLGAAIETASQIAYGRALYSEAQGAIARWGAQLDAIYAAREAEARRAASQEPVYYEEPAPSYQEPAYQEPTSYYQEPAYQEPAPSYQEPTYYQEPEPAYQEPAPAYQEPASYYQEPAPSYQEPAPSYQEPAS